MNETQYKLKSKIKTKRQRLKIKKKIGYIRYLESSKFQIDRKNKEESKVRKDRNTNKNKMAKISKEKRKK